MVFLLHLYAAQRFFFPKSAGGSLKPTRYSFTESLRCISLPIRILPDGFFPKPMGGGLFMKCAKHRDNFGFVSEPDSFVIIIMNSCSMTILTCTPIQYFLMFCDLSNLEVRIWHWTAYNTQHSNWKQKLELIMFSLAVGMCVEYVLFPWVNWGRQNIASLFYEICFHCVQILFFHSAVWMFIGNSSIFTYIYCSSGW